MDGATELALLTCITLITCAAHDMQHMYYLQYLYHMYHIYHFNNSRKQKSIHPLPQITNPVLLPKIVKTIPHLLKREIVTQHSSGPSKNYFRLIAMYHVMSYFTSISYW